METKTYTVAENTLVATINFLRANHTMTEVEELVTALRQSKPVAATVPPPPPLTAVPPQAAETK